jgi:hypothetical protein
MPKAVADQSCTEFDTPNFAAMAEAAGIRRLVCSHAIFEMKHLLGVDLTAGVRPRRSGRHARSLAIR